jgi:RHS repeat-associated protein
MTSRHVLENGVWKDYTLAYDGDNRLISVTGAASANFGYDGDGRRIWATTGVTTTVFIGNYYEWNVALGEGTSYYYAGATRLAMRKGSGEAAYFITDHLGSTNKLVTPTGAPLAGERQLYKPWGENRLSTLLTLTRYTYTGQYAQTEVGLMYYQARWYDPTLGRFAQADSIIPETSQGVQAWDRYAGMNNNPLKYSDPSGHWAQLLLGAAIGAVAGVAIVAFTHPNLKPIDYAQAAIVGATAGVLISSGIGIGAGTALGATLVGAGTGAATSAAAYAVTAGDSYNTSEMAANALIGAATGAASALTGPSVVLPEVAKGTAAVAARVAINTLGAEVSQVMHYEYFNNNTYPPSDELAKAGAVGFTTSYAGEVGDGVVTWVVTGLTDSRTAGEVVGSFTYNLIKNYGTSYYQNRGMNFIDCITEKGAACTDF